MATFQFRLVGTYFGSPNTQHVPFAPAPASLQLVAVSAWMPQAG